MPIQVTMRFRHIYEDLFNQVDGSQTKHTLCIGANFTQLGIIAANFAGLGEKFAVYKIPSAESGKCTPIRLCVCWCEISQWWSSSADKSHSWYI